MNLPNFTITIQNIEPQLTQLLNKNRRAIEALLQQSSFSWASLMQPLQDLDDQLHHFWSPINHLNSVMNSDELREAYNACLPKLSEYGTWLAHNEQLYQAIKSLADTELNQVQQKIIQDEIRDFKLAGVALNQADKEKHAQLNLQLSQLTTKFEENILDATFGWDYLVSDEKELSGLTEHAIATAQQKAQAKEQQGWLFTLDIPSYLAIMQHADSRDLRERFYRAYSTRASDQGPTAGQWDNGLLIPQILEMRQQKSQLLDYQTFAEYSLATKMAQDPQQVIDFLQQLAQAALAKAKQEYQELEAFAKSEHQLDKLEPWDLTYYSEKLREQRYDFNQEQVRPYFPVDHVVSGLFAIVEKLFQVQIKTADLETWHADVRTYAIYQNEELIAHFYFDLYAREHKRGGAWMDEAVIRRVLADGSIQLPAAYVTCNFNPPVGDDPALLTHDDVITLFHEFGHALQHILTTQIYPEVSGINGIPWDAVEVASQFLENWAWQEQGLQLIAKHYQTGEALPKALLDKMLAAKNYHAAMQMMRQLEFSLFDFILHQQFDPAINNQAQQVLDQVRAQTSVYPVPDFHRFQNSFSHIFAGGYAAGYYSYKWAEVMAADGFAAFKEQGIFNPELAQSWLENILQPGGSVEFAELFKRFRGRDPQVAALLEQGGIV